MKNCSKCEIEKPDSEFSSLKECWCRKCKAEYKRWYYHNFEKDTNSEKMREYRQTESGKASIKKTTEKRKEKNRKYAEEYRKNNPEKIKEYKNRTRKERQEKENLRRKTDTNFRIKCNLRTRVGRAITKGYKSAGTMELLGCDIDFFKEYLSAKFEARMNFSNYGKRGWHIDHILPCDSFDLSDPEQQKKCFHYTNLQPLWWTDNLKKGHKVLPSPT